MLQVHGKLPILGWINRDLTFFFCPLLPPCECIKILPACAFCSTGQHGLRQGLGQSSQLLVLKAIELGPWTLCEDVYDGEIIRDKLLAFPVITHFPASIPCNIMISCITQQSQLYISGIDHIPCTSIPCLNACYPSMLAHLQCSWLYYRTKKQIVATSISQPHCSAHPSTTDCLSSQQLCAGTPLHTCLFRYGYQTLYPHPPSTDGTIATPVGSNKLMHGHELP